MRLFSDHSCDIENPYLARAQRLAATRMGSTFPNPVVGCVIVRDGVVVGEAAHERAGMPHAEAAALALAGDAARGSDVYVTLEPCAHQGRTAPCAEALVRAGVATVTIGMRDPNPIASGGADVLTVAGIRVSYASDPTPFRSLNEGWLTRVSSGKPLVVAKVGASLDSAVAHSDGVRSSVTGDAGARVTASLRSRADAVLVGASTVRVDDPALTARDEAGTLFAHQPVRTVLCRSFVPDPDALIFQGGDSPVWVLVPDAVMASVCEADYNGARFVRYDESGDPLDGALRALADQGVGSVLVEPGPRLLAALVESNAIDRLVVVTAGGWGGEGSLGVFAGQGTWDGDRLTRQFVPEECEVSGDVMVGVWHRSSHRTESVGGH